MIENIRLFLGRKHSGFTEGPGRTNGIVGRKVRIIVPEHYFLFVMLEKQNKIGFQAGVKQIIATERIVIPDVLSVAQMDECFQDMNAAGMRINDLFVLIALRE